MEYKINSPEAIQEGVWNEQTCVRRIAGYSLKTANLPSNLKYLPKGAPLAVVNGEAVLVKTAKLTASASTTSVKVAKNHALVVGDTLKSIKINKIDTSDASYDTLTMASALTAENGEVIADANADKVVGLLYATKKIDSFPSVTITCQAYDIEEDSLPYAINDDIKKALTSRHAFMV